MSKKIRIQRHKGAVRRGLIDLLEEKPLITIKDYIKSKIVIDSPKYVVKVFDDHDALYLFINGKGKKVEDTKKGYAPSLIIDKDKKVGYWRLDTKTSIWKKIEGKDRWRYER